MGSLRHLPRARPISWAQCCAASVVALGLLLGGCAQIQPPPPTVPFDAAPYRAFIVPEPLAPFYLLGAVRFLYRGEVQSGDVSVQALPGPAYRLELRSALTGGLALELRITPQRLRVIDYVNDTVLQVPNTADARLRLFAVDLPPEDLQTLLTGRVGRARFAAGGGVLRTAAGEAEFREGAATHRFRLDEHGLPSEWVKAGADGAGFRVEFREYLELPQAGGPPLRLPRKVRLYTGSGPALLVVGVRDVRPGAQEAAAPPLDVLPPAAANFAPGELPERPAAQ
jgi:hypothetical protein